MPDSKLNVHDLQTMYQENLGPIYRYVYHKIRNREEAEDLTSQIFLKAIRGVDDKRDILSTGYHKSVPPLTRGTREDRLRVGGENTCVVPNPLIQLH